MSSTKRQPFRRGFEVLSHRYNHHNRSCMACHGVHGHTGSVHTAICFRFVQLIYYMYVTVP